MGLSTKSIPCGTYLSRQGGVGLQAQTRVHGLLESESQLWPQERLSVCKRYALCVCRATMCGIGGQQRTGLPSTPPVNWMLCWSAMVHSVVSLCTRYSTPPNIKENISGARMAQKLGHQMNDWTLQKAHLEPTAAASAMRALVLTARCTKEHQRASRHQHCNVRCAVGVRTHLPGRECGCSKPVQCTLASAPQTLALRSETLPT